MREITCGHDVHYAKGLCRICYVKHWNKNNPESVKRSREKFISDHPDYYKKYFRNRWLRKKAKKANTRETKFPELREGSNPKAPKPQQVTRHDDENRSSFLKRFLTKMIFLR
jgi:hypothetical protein